MEEDEIKCHRCGIRITPPALIITYSYSSSDKIRQRSMPLRFFNAKSKIETISEELLNNPRHKKFIRKLPRTQLESLLSILKDCLNGSTVIESLQRKCQTTESNLINPDEDLNKLGNEELNARKAIMNKLFEKNATKPTDKDFVYDIQIEYGNSEAEPCSWDCIYDANAVSVVLENGEDNDSSKKHDNYDTDNDNDDYDLDDDI